MQGLYRVSYAINLVPRASFPLTSGRKTRALGATISGMRHRCRCAVSRITRIRLFPLFFHNGCSQSSRFPTAGQGERSSGNEIGMPSEHRLKLAEKYFSVRFNCLFFFLQYTTNMSSTIKWKKPRLLLSKSFSQEVSFQVNIKYLIWIKVFFIAVYGLLHLKDIWNVSQLKFGEETTPQSSRVLESSTLFDRQTFLYICTWRKLFRSPKTLQIRQTSVYARIWYDSSLISKDKDHKNLPVSPFLPRANSRVDHWLPRENV